MAFTDRFVKLPVIKFDREESDLYNKEPEECDNYTTWTKINRNYIVRFEPTIPRGQDLKKENEKWTYIYLVDGNDFYIRMKVEEFEKLLNQLK